MAGKDDDFLIELDPDGEAPKGGKPEGETRQEKIDTSANDTAIEAMRRQLKAMEDERNAAIREREEAARQAREAAADATKAKGDAARSHYDMINGYIATGKARSEAIKREMKAANEAGDTDRLADLQMEAASIATRLLQYQDAKSDIEARAEAEKERRSAEPVRQERQPERPSDPFEAYVQSLSKESQSWLRQHRECVTDPEKNAEVMLGHQRALKKGLRADSQEYFDYLDEHMGYAQPKRQEQPLETADDEVEVIDDAKPEPRRSMPAAPVSRATPSREGQVSGNRIKLTRQQVEMAESLGMTPAEYGQHLIKLTKEGRYPNVYN